MKMHSMPFFKTAIYGFQYALHILQYATDFSVYIYIYIYIYQQVLSEVIVERIGLHNVMVETFGHMP